MTYLNFMAIFYFHMFYIFSNLKEDLKKISMYISPVNFLYNPKTPSFGCRMMAFVNTSPSSETDKKIREDFLINNPNSLKHLSKKGVYSVHGLKKLGHPDGWGIASYTQKSKKPKIQKSPISASFDFRYTKATNNLESQKPLITLAHIRQASVSDANKNNCHPFVYKNWSFEHNGEIAGALSPKIKKLVDEKYAKLLGEKPKGKTDSEYAFYYFLGKLKETYGTTNTKKIGCENIRKTFAESISELTELSGKKYSICTIIMSDGKNVFASRKGRSLFIGSYLNGNKKQYILSSEQIKQVKTTLIKWQEIPENFIVSIKRTKGGLKHAIYSLKEFFRK